MLEYGNIAPHPGMNVAFDGDRNFFPREGFLRRGARSLCLVPLPVVCRQRMNVVQGGVAVDHLQLLIGPYRQNVWSVHAAFLLDDSRLTGWRVKRAIAQAF